MRMKGLFGLLAIGGAVAYAQKKRGGELTVDGFKKTFREMFNSASKSASSMRSTAMHSNDDELPSYGSAGRVGTTTRSSYGDDFSSSPNGRGGSNGLR